MDPRLGVALAGRYTIDREVGRGGMAVVYLARDVRHNRNVALKVLNAELGAVLGVERFLAEIQVTANLQHPNLLPLFDSGEAEGLLFYVMPHVEGESLRARLRREKQLPVDEAVRITCAIAGALDYAHRHKVIHRDLKPENILMQEGQPLIADFGIALAVSNAGGERVTQTGISLGTPQYMSPEQATGDRVVDGRADIYSLGAMLYEMLAGDPPHTASTAQAIIAKVLTERPQSVRLSRPNVPAHVDASVAHALEKLAADRFETAVEFSDALRGKGAPTVSGAYLRPTAAPVRAASRKRELAAWSLVAALAALSAWQLRPVEKVEPPVVRAAFDLPPNTRVTDVLVGSTIAVSPKGDLIVYTATKPQVGHAMYVRRINELTARELGDISGRNIVFSPDGRSVAFTEGNVIKRMQVDGGLVSTLGSTGTGQVYGLAWGESGTIWVGSFSGMWTVPASGGAATTIITRDSATLTLGLRWPLLLPDGKAVVFATGTSSSAASRMGVYTVASNTVETFDVSMSRALGLMGDQLVFVSPTGGLLAVQFDGHRPVGDPVQLDEGVLVDATAGAKASLSASGTLVYLAGRPEFAPVRVAANASVAEPVMREPGVYSDPRYSPDGRRIALTVGSGQTTDIRIYDMGRNTLERLTTEGANIRPEWTPDGKRVLFISSRGGKAGIWWQAADGSSPAELLYQPEVEPFEALVSPDSKWLLFRTAPGSKYTRDILAVPMTGEKTVAVLVTSPSTENMPRLSPDGKWMAYQSNESGRFEIYVRPFPQSGGRVQVSDNSGTEPIWGRDGRTLYYREALGGVVEVGVTTGAAFSIGKRRTVVTGEYRVDASHASYDVGRDGRFLLLKRAGAESKTIIVHNWARELREKTARPR